MQAMRRTAVIYIRPRRIPGINDGAELRRGAT